MSLKTWLAKVESDISGLFSKAATEFEEVLLPAAVAITNTLQTVLTLDSTDIIGKLAGSAGAALEDKVRATLEKIVPELQLAQQWKGLTADQILTNVAGVIAGSTTNTKTAFWIEFSGMVAADFAKGNLTVGEATQLAQYFFQNAPGAKTSTTPVAPIPSSAAAPVKTS